MVQLLSKGCTFIIIKQNKMAYVAEEYNERQAFESKKYKGSTFGRVLMINPTMKEANETLGYTKFQEEPVYHTKKTAKNSKGVEVDCDNLKIDVYLKPENEKIDKIFTLTFFLTNAPAWTQAGDQVQVIDTYGNYSYVNPQDYDFKKPIYRTKKNPDGTFTTLDIIKVFGGHRIARQGEQAFRNFFKAFMQIKNPLQYVNKKWIPKDADELAKCDTDFELEDWKQVFKDFRKSKVYKDITSRIKQNQNGLYFIVGVKTTPDGKQYNEVLADVKAANQKGEWSDYDLQQMLKRSKIDFTDSIGDTPETKKTVILPIHEYNMDVIPSTSEEISEATTAAEATQQLDAESDKEDDLPF